MEVEIWKLDKQGEDVEVGKIKLVGGKLVASTNSNIIKYILSEPVHDINTGENVTAEEDPEAFLNNLRYQYRSGYLRATAPKEDSREVDAPEVTGSPLAEKEDGR